MTTLVVRLYQFIPLRPSQRSCWATIWKLLPHWKWPPERPSHMWFRWWTGSKTTEHHTFLYLITYILRERRQLHENIGIWLWTRIKKNLPRRETEVTHLLNATHKFISFLVMLHRICHQFTYPLNCKWCPKYKQSQLFFKSINQLIKRY